METHRHCAAPGKDILRAGSRERAGERKRGEKREKGEEGENESLLHFAVIQPLRQRSVKFRPAGDAARRRGEGGGRGKKRGRKMANREQFSSCSGTGPLPQDRDIPGSRLKRGSIFGSVCGGRGEREKKKRRESVRPRHPTPTPESSMSSP